MNFLAFARESKLFTHELGFEFAAVVGTLLFVLVLLKTDIRHKQRPMLIFCLYAGYAALQAVLPLDFFPFTAFQLRSYPEAKTARYVKVSKVMQDGSVLSVSSEPLLRIFSGGRPKSALDKIFNSPGKCERFAKAYGIYDFNRDPRVGHSLVRELHVENWKWDWRHDARDADHGFLVKRIVCKA